MPFSRRQKIVVPPHGELIDDDATRNVRFGIVSRAVEHLGPSKLRDLICQRLITEPDPGNWSDYPNVWDEVKRLVQDCIWYKVYDIAEDIYRAINISEGHPLAQDYETDVNEILASEAMAWKMESGQIVRVGLEVVTVEVGMASEALGEAEQMTAREAIEGALRDLSNRPDADTIGAVHKAMAALESTMRTLTGQPKATLGELLKGHPGAFPPPLGIAIEKLWGYASERGRHLKEGGKADRAEAELVVVVSSAACSYIAKKIRVSNLGSDGPRD